MEVLRLNLKYKQEGMTLVEVLIAGIILFISISVISIVARTKILNEQKLVKAIERAYLAEYTHSSIKYYLKYTQEKQGRFFIGNKEYVWISEFKEAKPYMMTFINEGGDESYVEGDTDNLLTLYDVVIKHVDIDKPVYRYTELIWGRI